MHCCRIFLRVHRTVDNDAVVILDDSGRASRMPPTWSVSG
ncbi:hypothetical protein I546_6054 [Mycobacterium kansasii 732]|nr:hypothetical protein I546_6054 [Mycobacterium kansasii 732]